MAQGRCVWGRQPLARTPRPSSGDLARLPQAGSGASPDKLCEDRDRLWPAHRDSPSAGLGALGPEAPTTRLLGARKESGF